MDGLQENVGSRLSEEPLQEAGTDAELHCETQVSLRPWMAL